MSERKPRWMQMMEGVMMRALEEASLLWFYGRHRRLEKAVRGRRRNWEKGVLSKGICGPRHSRTRKNWSIGHRKELSFKAGHVSGHWQL